MKTNVLIYSIFVRLDHSYKYLMIFIYLIISFSRKKQTMQADWYKEAWQLTNGVTAN